MAHAELASGTVRPDAVLFEKREQLADGRYERDLQDSFPGHPVTIATVTAVVQQETLSTASVAPATIPFVPGYDKIQAAVTEYVRDYIRAQRRRKQSYKAIGDSLLISHVWAMQLDQPEKYGVRAVGPDLEHRVAELLHGGSVDALRKAALTVASGGAVVVEQPGGDPLELTRVPGPTSAPPAAGSKTRRAKSAG